MFRAPRLARRLLLSETVAAALVEFRHDPNLTSVQLQRLALAAIFLLEFTTAFLAGDDDAHTLREMFGNVFDFLVPHGHFPPCGAVVLPFPRLVLATVILSQTEAEDGFA